MDVLGTPLLLTNYSDLQTGCLEAAQADKCIAVEFTNTQIVTLRRHDPTFHKETEEFDYFVPYGMPLIWCLKLSGARIHDRVYGPTFMRRVLTELRGSSTHFLLGGTEIAGKTIRARFSEANPSVRFVGSFHGKCHSDGRLDGISDAAVIEEINRTSPDFIWVGLGAPKQERWIHKHKHLIRRGVVLSVGFAFDVNAGTKRDAPHWMQGLGLTWLYRMCAEPRRLALRYLRYNSLFLFYLLFDGMRLRAWNRRDSVVN